LRRRCDVESPSSRLRCILPGGAGGSFDDAGYRARLGDVDQMAGRDLGHLCSRALVHPARKHGIERSIGRGDEPRSWTDSPPARCHAAIEKSTGVPFKVIRGIFFACPPYPSALQSSQKSQTVGCVALAMAALVAPPALAHAKLIGSTSGHGAMSRLGPRRRRTCNKY